MAQDDHQATVTSGTRHSRYPREHSRSGFTLIELLVVIAIIAILAAILFPVFAQAKRAALITKSLSNIKQQSIGILAYAVDYDDHFVIGAQWHSSDNDAMKNYPNSWYMPWTGLVENYLKNTEILISPLSRRVLPFFEDSINNCNTERQCKLLYPTYGYNTTYLSPSYRTDYVTNALSITNVTKPSEQIMLTEIWHRGTTKMVASCPGQDMSYCSFADSASPDSATGYPNRIVPFGHQSWGSYHKNALSNLGVTEEEGNITAVVAFRCAGMKTPTVFADGHAKVLSADKLADGTDWDHGNAYIAKNLVNGKYMWDPRGD